METSRVRKRICVAIAMFLLMVLIGGTVVSAAPATTMPLFPVNTGSEVQDYEKFAIWNYSWDPSGVMNQYDPTYMIANLLMFLSACIMRFGILIFSIGMHPDVVEDIFVAVVQVISNAPKILLERFWPFITVCIIVLLIWDYQKGDYQRMVKRGVSIVIVMFVLGVYNAISVPVLKTAADAADAFATMVAGTVVSLAAPLSGEEEDALGSNDFLKTETSVYNMIWRITVDHPWQMGEFGTIDAPIGEHVDDVRDALSDDKNAINVTAETRWREAFLHYPRGSDIRDDLVDVYEDAYPTLFSTAFSGEYRLLIAFFTFLASLVVFLFLTLIGGCLFALFLLFLAAVIAGVVVIVVALVPANQGQGLLRWYTKVLSFTYVGKVLISLYVGVVFLMVVIFSKTRFSALFSNGDSTGFIINQILNIFWYAAGLAGFVLILLNLKNKAMNSVNIRGGGTKSNDGYEVEETYELTEGNAQKQGKLKYQKKTKKKSSDFVDLPENNTAGGGGAIKDVVDSDEGRSASRKTTKEAPVSVATTSAGPTQSSDVPGDTTKHAGSRTDQVSIPGNTKDVQHDVNLNITLKTPTQNGVEKEQITLKPGDSQVSQPKRLSTDMVDMHVSGGKHGEPAMTPPVAASAGQKAGPVPEWAQAENSGPRSGLREAAVHQPNGPAAVSGSGQGYSGKIHSDTVVLKGNQPEDRASQVKQATSVSADHAHSSKSEVPLRIPVVGHSGPNKIHQDTVHVGHERGTETQPVGTTSRNESVGTVATERTQSRKLVIPSSPGARKTHTATPIHYEGGGALGKIHEDTVSMRPVGLDAVQVEKGDEQQGEREQERPEMRPAHQESETRGMVPAAGKEKGSDVPKPVLMRGEKKERKPSMDQVETRKAVKIHHD